MKKEFSLYRGRNLAKVSYKLVCLVAFMVVISSYTMAQGPDPEIPCEPGADPDGEGCAPNPEPTPIDGGASILIAGGIAYGLKKVYDKRKQNNEADIA